MTPTTKEARAHTEEAWIATPAGPGMRNGYRQSWAVSQPDACNLIAGVFSNGVGGEESAERNARLIAASPDLLKAARVLASLRDGDRGRRCPTNAECDQAEAAIAKATGQ